MIYVFIFLTTFQGALIAIECIRATQVFQQQSTLDISIPHTDEPEHHHQINSLHLSRPLWLVGNGDDSAINYFNLIVFLFNSCFIFRKWSGAILSCPAIIPDRVTFYPLLETLARVLNPYLPKFGFTEVHDITLVEIQNFVQLFEVNKTFIFSYIVILVVILNHFDNRTYSRIPTVITQFEQDPLTLSGVNVCARLI